MEDEKRELLSKIAELEREIDEIRHSFGYKLMRFYASRVDRLLPNGTARGEFRRMVIASLRIMTEKGFRTFLRQGVIAKFKQSTRDDSVDHESRRTIGSLDDIRACFTTREWQMEHAERLVLIAMVGSIRPRTSIEIGCRFGGSTSVLAHYSKEVFTLDSDINAGQYVSGLKNVRFVPGDSGETFPALLSKLEEENRPVDFVLIDGDHSIGGVYHDCRNLLAYQPCSTMFVLIHHSANPSVRAGILKADWKDNPLVQSLDLDFVPGKLRSRKDRYRQIWGGFALAILGNKPRKRELEIQAELDLTWSIVLPHSVYRQGQNP